MSSGQADSSLPATDHTTQMPSGHYLFAQSTHAGDTAWLVLRPFAATAGKNCQIRLYYYIYGSSVHQLNIKYRMHNAGPPDSQIWSSAGQQGPEWLSISQLISIDNPFQIIIEAMLGTASSAIALDDVSFTPDCQYNVQPLPPPPTPAPTSTPTSTAISSLQSTALPPQTSPTTPKPQPARCATYQIQCLSRTACYAKAQLCDGTPDCPDSSDESATSCSKLLNK